MKRIALSLRRVHVVAVIAATCIACSPATADITPYNDREDWFDAANGAGEITTLDFTGFDDGEIITDQYSHFGVTFTDGNDRIDHNLNVYPNDDWGMSGVGPIRLAFDEPIHWIAADWPGAFLDVSLYRDNELVGFWRFFGQTVGNFSGLKSSEEFDLAVLSEQSGIVFIDDLHFVTIPAPGAAIIFLGVILFPMRRRSR